MGVIVVTGASSGIGRAVALRFAARRDRVVLAARAADPLLAVRSECEGHGAAAALSVPTDITDADAVQDLATRAVAQFGRIDVWVHTAAVMAYGRFEDLPPRVFRHVVETDLMGSATVARVALERFRRQRAGTLILTGSVLGQITAPYLSAYATSKWGMRGLARVLRQETRDAPRIHVCTVDPGSVDTPIYRRAATYLGRHGSPPWPVADPDRVAKTIVRCADRPRARTSVGRANLVMRAGFALAPPVFDALVGPLMRRAGLGREQTGNTEGNVFSPSRVR